jgi:TonB-linked SusC/RagA family outer membrane protein
MKQLTKLILLMALLFGVSQVALAQYVAKGTVKDAKGEPLTGVSVVLKGTTRGTITDIDGNYSLDVPSEASNLVFSYVGYTSITGGANAASGIVLEEDLGSLEEVVVTGLASTIKRSNAGSAVARITAEELTGSTRPQTLDGALSGKVIGANIVANSGAPGGGISVKLRGISSILGSSEPLFVIDGVIIDNSQFNTGAGTKSFNGAVSGANAGSQDQAANRISDLNPADIESIDVLKGPSAAAVYGTRANAGVIVITTKRGKAGKTVVKFGQDIGMSEASHLLPSENWTEAKINGYGGVYGIPTKEALALFKASNGQTIDYDKLIFGEKGAISTTNLSVSGGSDKTKFYLSGSLSDETGIVKYTGFGRRSIRANIDHRINNFVDIKISSSYMNTNSSRAFLGNDNNGVSLGYSIAYVPNFIDLRPVNGVYPAYAGTGQNPFQVRDRMENKESTNRFLQSGEVNFNLLNEERNSLKLSVKGGVDYLVSNPKVYAPEDMQYQAVQAQPGASRYATNKALLTYLQTFLTYNWGFQDVDLMTQVGVLKDIQKRDESWIQGVGLLPGQRNPSTAASLIANSYLSEQQVAAVVGQQEINWANKIIVRGGVRADRASLNGDNTKWYLFPMANIAVNLGNFGFLPKEISTLKPRLAFGRTGGVPQFGDIYTTLASGVYDGKLSLASPTTIGNSGLKPETAQELEGGIDIGFFKNRIMLEATMYDKRIYDFLFQYTLASGTGVNTVTRFPVGDFTNKGVELGITANIIKSKDLDWTTTLQFWNNKSNVTRLIVPAQYVPSSGFGNFGRSRIVQGYSPTLWWGVDDKGKLTPYQDNQPKFQMSWSNSLSAYGVSFNMLWHTSQGGYNSSLNRELKDEAGTTYDWTNVVKNLDSPRLYGNPGYSTADYLFSSSYIRLREVSLYYTVPKMAVASAFKDAVSNIRIGVSANNILTISDYLKYNYDPEASNFGNRSVGSGVDLTPFPASKRYFAHLVCEF